MRLALALLAALAALAPRGAAAAGHLKWTFSLPDAYYPYDSPYPPAVVRGAVPGDDRVVALSRDDESGGWRASALNIDTGAPVWHAVFPATAPGDVPYGVTAAGGDAAARANSLNLALLVIAGQLVALDGGTGALAWRHALPPAARLGALSAWDDTVALLLRGAPEPGASPWAPPPTTLVGLDAAGGAPRWSVNASAALPALRAEAGAYAVETLLAAEGVVVYARANRLAGLDPASGAVRWTTQLAVDGSVGAGQAANITDLVYVPPPMGDALAPPRLLATANNWSFLRFILLTMDAANATAPPALGWRSRLPETALAQEWLIRPVADASVNMFYTWANRTDWTTGAEFPPSEVYLVGRSLTDGKEVWSARYEPAGLPSAENGRLFAAATTGLLALQGSTGQLLWAIDEPAEQPRGVRSDGSVGSLYTYNVAPTFGNETGQLVASRCLGPGAPALCMYSAFAPKTSAAARPSAAAAAAAAALIAALAAAVSA